MTCPTCGQDNPDRARFCLECGVPFPLRCSSCATDLPAGAKFCLECGTATGRAAPAPERDPRSYTPKHLAEKILQSKSALEGERKQVTVLFADVKGSMELQEGVDPEEWHRIMDRFFQILSEGVHRFEGTVNQYTGDGIMALFGAPIAHEDHAQRACYAALHLRDALREYGQELRRERGLDFLTRIGLNSGEVVVGKIGDDLRMDYTAQGHTVGLAERTQQLAEPAKPYLTERTAALVRGYFQLENLGAFSIKGVGSPVQVYGLEGPGELRTRLDISRARGFSRFVGRVDEMATLELALKRAREGDGQVMGVVGQAGVGKSRLCLQFVEQCRAGGIRVLEAHCPAHGKTVSLLPILELLRGAFGIAAEDTDQAAREKIAGRLLLLDRAFDDTLPLVFDFLGVPDPAERGPEIDPEARQRQLCGFLRRWVHATGEREPLVLLFDDIQWIDEGSDAYLTELVAATSGTRALLLGNFRPEYRAEWMGGPDYRRLVLSPLSSEAIDELLHELLGGDPTLAGLHDLIHERTGGNPFFIEEVVQSLVESKSLSGARGAYRLVAPVEELAIPATVQPVLAARIDRLPEREKQVLQTAAVATVVDKRLPESLLSKVAALPGADLAAALGRLVADEFLVEEALYPEREYAFKHPLTQAVAYETQLSNRRAGIHAALAGALMKIHEVKPEEHAALIAHHWEQAGEELEAARWHRRAALGWRASAATERRRHWKSVLRLVKDLPDSSEATALDLQARCRLIAHEWYGSSLPHEEATTLFEEGRRRAERVGDRHALIQLHWTYAVVRLHQGAHLDQIEPMYRKAVQLADELGDPGPQLQARFQLQCLALVRGDLPESLRVARTMEELEPDLELGRHELAGMSPYVGSQTYAAVVLGRSGRIDEGFAQLERIAALAGANRFASPWLIWGRAVLERLRGDAAAALRTAQEQLRLAVYAGSSVNQIMFLTEVGLSNGVLEDWAESARAFEEALHLAAERQLHRNQEPELLAGLCTAQLGMGDVEAACRSAESAIAISTERGYVGAEIAARLARAGAIRRRDGLEGRAVIDAALNRATELIEATSSRSLAPGVEIERAELARLQRDDATVQHHLREAHRLYIEMGATGHAERVARELRV